MGCAGHFVSFSRLIQFMLSAGDTNGWEEN